MNYDKKMNNLKWIPVISSNIKSVPYEEKTNQMFVMFINYDAVYVHEKVNKELIFSFLNSASKGKFYAKIFKNK